MLTAAVLTLGLLAGFRPPIEPIAHRLEPLAVEGCFERLALDPSDPDVLYGYARDPASLRRSDDGGLTWSTLGVPGNGLVSVVVSPLDSSRLYALANGFYVSADAGGSWTKSGGAPAGLDGELVLDPFDPLRVYVASNSFRDGTVIGAIWFSPDGGEHWSRRDAGLPLGMLPSQLTPIVPDPRTPGVFLVAQTGAGLYRTADGGESWTLLSGELVSPTAWGAGATALWGVDETATSPVVSMDGGITWDPRPIVSCTDPLVTCIVADVVPDPTVPGVAYAILIQSQPFLYRDSVYRTDDFGGLWSSLRGNYPPSGFRDIAVGATGTLWVGACGAETALYRRLPDRRTTTLPLR